MMEAMHARLQHAVSLHVEHLKRAGNQLTGRLAADVFLDAIGECRLAQSNAPLIVIELDVIHKEGSELFEVTFVVGIKQRRIECRAGTVKILLILNFVQWRSNLSRGNRG